MSSRIFHIAALILTFCAGISAGTGKDRFAEQIAALQLKDILSRLQNAQTIVLADFKEPQGTFITRVIRGDDKQFKPGQSWNDSLFPKGPILIYQRTNDLIGNATGDFMSTGYYPLDETQRFLVRESIDMDTRKKEKHLIPLESIYKIIGAPTTSGSGSGQSSCGGPSSDKPSPPPAK